jgi:LacI family transcriptional regulator
VKQERSKPAGIKEIAAALNISIGTVDRALHARPGVNADTRSRVLKMAEELNYRPNVAARNLKLNRNVRIAVHLPEQIATFYDPVRDGIRAAAREGIGGIAELAFRTYPTFYQEDLRSVEEDLEQGYDGFILAPGNPRRIDPLLRKIAATGASALCVATDAPHSPRLGFVGSDAFACGAIAAELLAMRLQSSGTVAIVTGDLSTEDHAEKLRGFAGMLAVTASHLHLLPAIEAHDSPEQAYRQTLKLLARRPSPSGIYIGTANSLPVLRAIEEHSLLGQIQVVSSDLFAELIPLIETGGVLATLHQRPFTQGKLAFEALARFLLHNTQPNRVTKLVPHIVLRSNVRLFAA